jgi:DNA-directed RNA polymerase specialized sigma24 family protein
VKYSIDDWLPYKEMMQKIASDYQRRYPMVEVDDLHQEMYLWFVSHPRKFKEWMGMEQKDSDKLIAKSLRNQCLKYCEREKARVSGYDVHDLYYYDISVVEAFLPSIISESYEMPTKIKDLGNQVKSGEISDGMNWLALRADIAKAYYSLPEGKQHILSVRFEDEGSEWNKVAEELGTTADGARMKVQRALGSLVQHLGGWRPYNDQDTQEATSDTEESSRTEEVE